MLYETLALAFWMLEAMNDFLSAFCFKWPTYGSAMSSLVPFFRFVYPCGGCICIDGVCFEGIDFHSSFCDACLY